MNNDTDSSTDKPAISIPHKEITDFELSMEFSHYRISYGDRSYPIIMTPYDFLKLFEVEGIPIESFTGDEPIKFTKAVLVRSGYTICGDAFDEEGGDITPQLCWVKQDTPYARTPTDPGPSASWGPRE